MNQRLDNRFKFCPGKTKGEMQGRTVLLGNIRLIYIRLHAGGKFYFDFFRRVPDPLESLIVFLEIDAMFFAEFGNNPFHNSLVKIVPTQVGIAIGSLDFKYSFSQLEDGYVKSPPSQVVDSHSVGVFFIQAISQGGCCRFVDDSFHF